MAGLFEGWGGDSVNPAAEIARGIARGMQESNAKELLAELNTRETFAKRLEEIEKDREYAGVIVDEKTRKTAQDLARDYAMQLRWLKPTDKRPKDFLPDKALQKMGLTGIEATPAWFRVTMRKKARDGPDEPAQPAEPPDPSAELSAPPSIGAMDASAPPIMPAGGMEPGTPMLPPMPGGEQIGPNQITAAPAVPGAPAALPPPPSIGAEYESARRSPQDLAREDAELSRIKNSVSLEPDAQGMVDSRALPALGRQQTAAIQLRKLGLQADGVTPVPPEQMTPAEQQKIAHLRAQDELLDAQQAFVQAKTAYEQQRDDFTRRTLDIAESTLQVKQQNANTAASRVQMEGALYGDLLNSGGAQPFIGGLDMDMNDPVDAWSELVHTQQAKLSDVPQGKFGSLKNAVVLNMVRKGLVIAPPALQKELTAFSGAKAAIETIYEAVDKYSQASGSEAIWKGLQISGVVAANSRIVGKAMGELRITDQDKGDFERLLSPGKILTLTNPERAKEWVLSVKTILDRVERENLQGFYQRVYARKDQTLDTLRPGDTKNVIGVSDGSGTFTPNPAYQPPAPPRPAASATIPPIEQRVAGVTRAMIGGVERIWNGTGWAKVKK